MLASEIEAASDGAEFACRLLGQSKTINEDWRIHCQLLSRISHPNWAHSFIRRNTVGGELK
jgi:hypothetical protein